MATRPNEEGLSAVSVDRGLSACPMKASNTRERTQIELILVRRCTNGLGGCTGPLDERRQFSGLSPVEDQNIGEEEGSSYSDELSKFRPGP